MSLKKYCKSGCFVLGINVLTKNIKTFVLFILLGLSTIAQAQVTVNSATICTGASVILTASGGSGSFIWDNGVTTSTANPLSVTPATTTTYTVYDSGNPADFAEAQVNVTDLVAVATPAAQTICSGTNGNAVIALTNNFGNTTSFSWVSTANNINGASSSTISSPGNIVDTLVSISSLSGDATYTIIPTNGACVGAPVIATIVLNPQPGVLPSVFAQTICSGNSTSIDLIPDFSGTTLSWTVVQGNTSGATAGTQVDAYTISQPLVTLAPGNGTANYKITPTAKNCTGDPVTIKVTVKQTPQITNVPLSQTVCSGIPTTAVTLTADLSNTWFTWSADPGLPFLSGYDVTGTFSDPHTLGGDEMELIPTQTITNTSNVTQVVTFSITVNDCVPLPITEYKIYVEPTPKLTVVPNRQEICSGDASTLVNLTSDVLSVFTWTSTGLPLFTNNLSGQQFSSFGPTTVIPSQTISTTNFTSDSVLYTVKMVSNDYACEGFGAYGIIVKPLPDIISTPATSDTICSDSTFLIALSSNVSNTTFAWTYSTPGSVSGGTDDSNDTIQQTLNTTLFVRDTAFYTIIGTADGCPGNTYIDTVLVDPTPDVTTPNVHTLCSDSVTNIPLTSNVAGTSFSWVTLVGAGITILPSGNISIIKDTLINNSNVTDSVIYTVTPIAEGCPGIPYDIKVYVHPTPDVNVSPATLTICSDSAVTLTLTSNVAGTAFDWTADQSAFVTGASAGSDVGTLKDTLYNSANTVGFASYTITPTANGCPGIPITYTVNVNPTPDVIASPASPIVCSDSVVNVSLTSAVAGTSFSWTVTPGLSVTVGAPGNSGTTILDTLYSSGNVLDSAVYVITPLANGCPGLPMPLTVTVNPTPNVTASSATICSGDSTNITLSGLVSGTFYTWTVSQVNVTGALAGSDSFAIEQPLVATGVVNGTATYIITPVSDGCPGAQIVVTVTVKPAPLAVATPTSDSVCSGSATNISLTNNMGGATTYAWTVGEIGATGSTASSGNIITQTLTASGLIPGTVTYTIVPTNNGCSGNPIFDTVTVFPLPIVTATPNAETICSGGTTGIALSSNINPGTTYSWTVVQSNVTGASANTGSAIAQVLTESTGIGSGTATYSVVPSAGGCIGTPISVPITVNPLSVATPSAANICSGSSPTITLTSPILGTTFDWTVVQVGVAGARDTTGVINGGVISQSLTATGSAVGIATYSVIPSAGGCAGMPVIVTVQVSPYPTATVTPTAQTICSGNASSLTLTNNISGATYNWTVVQTDVSGGLDVNADASGAINQTLTNSVVTSGTAVYTITPVLNGCAGSSVTATVTVNPVSTASPSSPTICSGTSPDVALVSPVVGTTFDWTVLLQNNVSGASDDSNKDSIKQVLTLTGPAPGTVQYNVIPSAAGCAGTPIVVNVTVLDYETASFNYSTSTFCPANADPTPTVTGTTGGTFKASPAGLVFVSTATGEVDLSATTLGTYTVMYTTGGLCKDSSTFVITVSNPPSAAFTYVGPYCKNGVNPLPNFFPGVSSPGVFTASPGLVFSNQFTGEIDLTLSAPGTYTVVNTITCVVNITASSVVTILPYDDASFNYSSGTYCTSGADPIPTVTGIAGGTFAYSPAGLVMKSTATGELDLSASTNGVYEVTYTTPIISGGCQNTGTFTVTISNPPAADFFFASAYCQNSTPNAFPTFNAGASGGVFTAPAGLVFANQFTGEVDLTASTPGTYMLTNTIPGCSSGPAFIDSSAIIINPIDNANFNYSSGTFCQTAPNPLPTITGLAGGLFSASPAGLVFANTGTGEVDLAASNPILHYTITYTTAGVCPNTSTFDLSITTVNPPRGQFRYDGPFCTNGTNPLPVYTAAGGSSGGVFSSTAGLVFADIYTGEIDVAQSTPGNYVVTNTIDCNGTPYTYSNSLIIDAADDAAFHYSYSTFCKSGTDPIPTIDGLAGGVFSASPAGVVFISAATGAIDLSASTVGTYTVTYTTAGGTCPNTDSFVINITNAANPGASFSYAGNPYCQSTTPDAEPTFAAGSFPGVFSASPAGLVFADMFTGHVNLTTSAQGTYMVYNTYDCSGVTKIDSAIIDIVKFPSFTVPANPYACEGDSVLTTSFVNIPTYTWVNSNPAIGLSASGSGNVPGFVATNTTAADIEGEITVTSTLSGCVGQVSTYTVTVGPKVSADAGVDASIISGVPVTLGGNPTGLAGSSYVWTPASAFTDNTYANPTAKINNTTLFKVVVTNGSCSATDSVLITVIPQLVPPGGITPNGDGVNDGWIIDFLSFYPNNVVEIYNRWGRVIFQSNGYTTPWEGKDENGKELPVGTYYYIINLHDSDYPDAITGPVTIMR